PLDRRSERDEEAAEILHVRLAGGVADHRLYRRQDGLHDRVLGRHDARLVEQDERAGEPDCAHLVAPLDCDLCSAAAMRLAAPVLFPAAWTDPFRGCPPSMTKACISASATAMFATSGRLSYPRP